MMAVARVVFVSFETLCASVPGELGSSPARRSDRQDAFGRDSSGVVDRIKLGSIDFGTADRRARSHGCRPNRLAADGRDRLGVVPSVMRDLDASRTLGRPRTARARRHP
jgi:hypothetical protein